MVIDTSAVVAIPFEEKDQLRYIEATAGAVTRLVSAVLRAAKARLAANGWNAFSLLPGQKSSLSRSTTRRSQ